MLHTTYETELMEVIALLSAYAHVWWQKKLIKMFYMNICAAEVAAAAATASQTALMHRLFRHSSYMRITLSVSHFHSRYVLGIWVFITFVSLLHDEKERETSVSMCMSMWMCAIYKFVFVFKERTKNLYVM